MFRWRPITTDNPNDGTPSTTMSKTYIEREMELDAAYYDFGFIPLEKTLSIFYTFQRVRRLSRERSPNNDQSPDNDQPS